MAPKSRIPTVKSIQSLLNRIGSATSGKREIIVNRLSRDLERPRIWTTETGNRSKRILSIDMGIKNLAFCVANVKRGIGSQGLEMSLEAWRRLNVTEEVLQIAQQHSSDEVDLDAVVDGEPEDPFTPSALSLMAYKVVKQTLLTYDPDIILIERQRWRSSGGSAIQQWTVRVNTFEGMLWAILTALRAEAGAMKSTNGGLDKQYQVFGVDPKRVGNFWVGDDVRMTASKVPKQIQDEEAAATDEELGNVTVKKAKVPSRGKVEKRAKIELVRSWLSPKDARATINATLGLDMDSLDFEVSPIAFKFSEEAQATRHALCSPLSVSERRSRKKAGTLDVTKLDDVADCLLQATAFVAWEENRGAVKKYWDRLSSGAEDEGGSPGKTPESAPAAGKRRRKS
ncbi:ribonuclease H-like protein [Polyplosphaeria fusca]|uniref:Ribonuclease H-like protein n=1 Tax=Polyplosphaeria fusca TaxID=682080 RepID=A0A9P4R5V8_9PLEO|nr:ribonuclease H-like protein [Polyplosphaeria fusca]